MTAPDETVRLALSGYEFISQLRREHDADVVEVRLLGVPVTCLGGPDAAALFYDEERFERRGALPKLVKRTLTGDGGVQGLDDAAHRIRKSLFMSLMTPEGVDSLARSAATHWDAAVNRWRAGDRPVVLFDEASEVFTRAACSWAGAPLPAVGAAALARTLVTMVDGFATVGPRHLQARRARRRAEQWARKVIDDIRRGALRVPEGSAADVFATHEAEDGNPLPIQTAAVELLNVVRPITAVAWYVAFAGHALHHHPQWQERLRAGADADLDHFPHEVRRFYPFAPFLGARVRQEFSWHGHTFPPGRLALLDVYGINHDPRIWPNPGTFDPDRFSERRLGAYDLIPQGGGSPEAGHRCAGERITMELLRQAVRRLAGLDHEMPYQDLTYSLRRIPTRPRSGVVLDRVRVPASSGVATMPP